MVEHRAGWLDPVFLALTITGYGGLLWIALAPALARGNRLRTTLLTAGAVWTADLITLLVKLVVERPRPFETIARPEPLLEAAVGQSMPSGHAATSAAGALVLWYLTRRAAVLLVLLALAMGYSRVYVGAHYPFDVLAGFAIGLAVAGCAIAAVELRSGRRPSGIRPPGARARPEG